MRGPAIGIDLGGTKIEGVALDAAGVEMARRRVATERDRGYDHILDAVVALIRTLEVAFPTPPPVGIGTPGSRSLRDGTLKNSNTLCLNGRPVQADLEARLGRSLVMENDANCFALAEALGGAGQGHDVVFGVILGTGVGGGLVHQGRLWSGRQHIAGEWGHHRIAPDGPDCYCGHRGCVETFLSGPALEAAYRAQGGEPIDAATIVARAAAGDARAEHVFDAWLVTFGRALANVINILDPDVIVLGGGLSRIDAIYDRGRAAVAAHVFNDECRTPIVRHALGDAAGVLGAAYLAASR